MTRAGQGPHLDLPPVKLRIERNGDAPAVRDVIARAFGGDHGEVVAHLVDSLRQSSAWEGLGFVAEDRDELAWMTGTLVYPEPFWRHDCVGRREPGSG